MFLPFAVSIWCSGSRSTSSTATTLFPLLVLLVLIPAFVLLVRLLFISFVVCFLFATSLVTGRERASIYMLQSKTNRIQSKHILCVFKGKTTNGYMLMTVLQS